MSSDLKRKVSDLVDLARSQGWRVVLRRGHYGFHAPDGSGLVWTGSTPSDYRGVRNLRAQLRRAGLTFEEDEEPEEPEEAPAPARGCPDCPSTDPAVRLRTPRAGGAFCFNAYHGSAPYPVPEEEPMPAPKPAPKPEPQPVPTITADEHAVCLTTTVPARTVEVEVTLSALADAELASLLAGCQREVVRRMMERSK